MELNEATGITGALKQANVEKAKVEVHLTSGKSFAGLVQAIGDHHVVMTELSGKEFFGAVVRLGDIAAVETRLRK